MRRIALLIAAGGVAGCLGASPLPLPPGAESARSGVLLLGLEDGPEVLAFDLGAPVTPFTTRDTPVYLFLYPLELSALGIAPGRLEKLGDAVDGRPLPDGAIFAAQLPEARWSPTDRAALPDAISGFRVPDLAIGDCEASGGCFRIAAGDEYCQLPCVEPTAANPAPPAPVAPPMPPELTPCRAGWTVLGPAPDRPEALCAPPSQVACRSQGAVRYLGDDGCSIAGGACPAGEFPEDLPAGPILYVRAGAAGGDGSPALPFGSIQQAIGAGGDGAVIAIGKGRFAESLSIDRDVSLIGACAETIVASTIEVSARVSLGSLSVTPGPTRAAVRIDEGGVVAVADVVVSTAAVGFDVRGRLEGGPLVVSAARGIEVTGESVLDRALVSGGSVSGVAVRAAGMGTFSNLLVSSSSAAVIGDGDSMVTLEGADLASNRIGLLAEGRATIEANDSAVVASSNNGIMVRGQAQLNGHRLYARDNWQSFYAEGGTTVIEHAYLERPTVGSNVLSDGSAVVTLRRAVLAGSRKFGLHAFAGKVTLEQVQIRDNETNAANSYGEGIVVDGPVVLEARKLSIERVVSFGIRVLSTDEKAELRLDDLTIRDVRGGYGIEVGRSYAPAVHSTLTIHGLLAERTDNFAVRIVSGEANEITDATLRGLPAGGMSTIGGVLNLTRAELTGIAGPSLSVTSGEMVLADLTVTDPENGLVTEGYLATDVSAIDSAMNVNRFVITGASGAGILIRQFSRMKLGAGRIVDNQVGVEVRADGFLYSNLEGDVIYRGNVEHNLVTLGLGN